MLDLQTDEIETALVRLTRRMNKGAHRLAAEALRVVYAAVPREFARVVRRAMASPSVGCTESAPRRRRPRRCAP